MNKVQRVSSLRAAVNSAKQDKKTIGFVPTMGNLHDGHLELVRAAKQRADFVVVSIYVNPTQFGANEDLANYPSTPDDDARLLAELGTDCLFLPEQSTIYPSDLASQTRVYVPELGDRYCGQDRPEHFYGVTAVVSRLFNMVQPDVAVFGKKDYQQLAIIRKMTQDLAYPIQIVGVDTVRNDQGLALSSRNGYLTPEERVTAANLQRVLQSIKTTVIEEGAVKSKKALIKLQQQALSELVNVGFNPQYVEICRQVDLQPAKRGDRALVVLAAASIGNARLIDNIEINLDEVG